MRTVEADAALHNKWRDAVPVASLFGETGAKAGFRSMRSERVSATLRGSG